MKNKVIKYSLVGLGALGFSNAQAVLIDDFSTDQFVQISGAAPQTEMDTVAGAGIIGAGDRDLTVEYIAGPGNPLDTTTAGASGSQFTVANGVTSNSVITLEWDAQGDDLTEGGLAEGFFLSLPNPIDNDLTVEFILNGSSSFANTFPNGSSGNDFFIPFAAFSNPGAATGVGTIQMVLSDGPGWDAAIDFVETRPREPDTGIPAPGTFLLTLTGLLGLIAITLKNKKAA